MTPVTHDPISERAVCAVALASGPAVQLASSLVTADDFYDPTLGHVFDLTCQAYWEKRPHDGQAIAASVLAEGGDPDVVVGLVGDYTSTEASSVRFHAEKVREYATRRRLVYAARNVLQRAENPAVDTATLSSFAVQEITQARDSDTSSLLTIRTLGEVMAEEEAPYEWVIPGLLERGDRFVLTGAEGLGKSMLLRQIAIMSAAGLNPFFRNKTFTPARVMLIDVENTEVQFRRKSRAIRAQSRLLGCDPDDNMWPIHPGRIDITTDRYLSEIHRALDAYRPDILVLGPLYKMVPRALQTDDEALPVLVALDSIRERGVCLVIEAHAGHATGASGERNYRPRGTSALLGWPEFGRGLAPCLDVRDDEPQQARLMPWRGDRDERDFPDFVRHGQVFPWEGIPRSRSWTPHDKAVGDE
jgi:hypothetical protein